MALTVTLSPDLEELLEKIAQSRIVDGVSERPALLPQATVLFEFSMVASGDDEVPAVHLSRTGTSRDWKWHDSGTTFTDTMVY